MPDKASTQCNLYEMQLQPEPLDPGLLVGYGNIKDAVIDDAVAALAEVIRASGSGLPSYQRARVTFLRWYRRTGRP